MRMRIGLKASTWKQLIRRLHEAYASGPLRLVKRIQSLLYIVDDTSVTDVALILDLSEQSVYNYVTAFVRKGLDSLGYKYPSGRPPKLTQSQRKELARLIDQGPEEAGYDCGGWNTALIQDLILTHYGVEYTPQYIAQLLKTLGYSWQKARFVSDHLDDVAEEQKIWMEKTWPAMLQLARTKHALLLFGDECSFAQWGSLSYTWARRGHQPTVKTSGKRKGYKVFGFIDYFSGSLFYKGQTDKFTSETYQAFIEAVLSRTTQPLIILQDGAKYHTSKAMQEFFAAHVDRITVQQLPRYSPEFNPIEHLWRNVKKLATHLRYFATYDALINKVEYKLQYFTHLPESIKGLMGKYCKTLGAETAA
jgi:transposase